MASTNFIDYVTRVTAEWLNDVNDFTYTAPTSTGSALIGHIDDVSGAEATTVQEELRKVHYDLTGKPDEGIGPPATDPLTEFASHAAKTSITSTDPGNHSGASLGTMAIGRNVVGSGTFGTASKDYALLVECKKDDYLTSSVDGEIDTLLVNARQGRKGDVGGVIIDLSKVRTGAGDDSGGGTPMEIRSEITNAAGTTTLALHAIPAFTESSAGLSAGGGYGHWVEARKGAWYSGYHVGTAGASDGSAYEGANSFTWAYSAASSRSASDVFYGIEWGTGNIYMGKPANRRIISYDATTSQLQIRDEAANILFTLDDNGILSVPGGTQIGSGAVKTKEFIARGTHDPASIPAHTAQDLVAVTVTGAAIGDVVDAYITTTGSAFSSLRLFGTVTATDTVTLKGHNITAGALDLSTFSYVIIVRRYT